MAKAHQTVTKYPCTAAHAILNFDCFRQSQIKALDTKQYREEQSYFHKEYFAPGFLYSGASPGEATKNSLR